MCGVINVKILSSSTGGPGFNPQSMTALWQRRYEMVSVVPCLALNSE